MKKKILALITAVLVLSSCMTAYAAPKAMPDGNLFDAEYYAAANPDVAAVLGQDEAALYKHYVLCGQAEGRLPYMPQQEVVPQNVTPNDIAEVHRIVNVERANAGVGSLSLDSALSNCAAIRAKEMYDNDVFSHTRPNGTSCFTVFRENGVSYGYAGENIAWGHRNAAEIMDGWMNSPGHRANILKSQFHKIGVGHYDSYWVQLFTN